ncbi:MAG TPA: zinc-binding dehydrogenase [Frankiaceae bacterium]|jgi:propanol-preferring alcohol dehydrogenase|nr:zinc-binding dehydrogenase [Frankiaceae bacterium]
MKAARVEDGVLQIRDLPMPVPGEGDALIRITAAGVCHSDLHLARQEWAGLSANMNLGHEAIGIVEALGPGADRFVKVGDRVILGLGGSGGGYWCGACRYCLSGQPRHCRESKGIIGTFAEYFCVWARSLVTIPDSLGDNEAPLACGGLTAYGAVKKLLDHRVLPGRPVAVLGAAGGLGHYAVQLTKAFGYQVIGVDVGAERLDFVTSLGADLTLDATDPAAVDRLKSEIGGVDASLVFSAKMAGFRLGFDLLGPRGLFVGVGLPAASEGNLEFNPFQLFMKDATIIYSAVGTVQDMRELVDLAVAGKVTSHVSRVGALSELPAIFDELAASRYLGRAVLTDLSR